MSVQIQDELDKANAEIAVIEKKIVEDYKTLLFSFIENYKLWKL